MKNIFKTSIITTLLVSCSTSRAIKERQQSIAKEMNDFIVTERENDLQNILSEKAPVENPDFLKEMKNPIIKNWIKYFSTTGRARFERYMINGEKYRTLIEETFNDYGLPQELYFVGLIESGYYLQARSSQNAVGPWQFIKSTGERYGLKIQNGIDERRNIEKSTKAAALFFQDLYNIFGSWELALSAYNAGEYGIIKRIRGAKTRDFYELSEMKKLPKETMHYVPKVLAAMEVYNNHNKYGIKHPGRSGHFYRGTETLKIHKTVNLEVIANSSHTSVSRLKELNPEILNDRIPYIPKHGLTIRVPSGKSMAIAQEVQKVKELKTPETGYYKVSSGDNLISISKKFNISPNELKDLNSLTHNKIIIGQKLRVPSSVAKASSLDEEVKSFENYKVKKGDNLYSIARNFHTTKSQIEKMNSKNLNKLLIGQTIRVPKITRTYYIVKRGDVLEKIAKNYGVSVNDIKNLNTMEHSKIYPGQKLIVKAE